MNPDTALEILGLLVTIAIPIFGYVIATTRGYIKGVSDSSKERFELASKEIAASESRLMAQIRDNESRAEKGDERVLAHVNSQFTEINAQLRDIREMLLRKGDK